MSDSSPLTTINELAKQFQQKLGEAQTEHEIFQVKASTIGRQGHLSKILKGLKELSSEERPLIGQAANEFKREVESSCEQALQNLKTHQQQERIRCERLDQSLPGLYLQPGGLHPITQVLQEVGDIFQKLGFQIEEGPQIESDYYNFEALNIPADHPARDMQDTFYLTVGATPRGCPDREGGHRGPPLLLRTHTSPVQIRVMKSQKPPVQMIAPGAVYRRDSDISHTPEFHQVEGLLVDRNVSFGHLKGMLELFVHEFFGPETAVRFRPSYFPFTEPSAEVDISCVMCPRHKANGAGSGCRVCQMTGWLEVIGCGMVHPAVFRSVRYDPEKWSGYAFGMGIERLAMLRYRINDIRLFYENDLRFLEQFR